MSSRSLKAAALGVCLTLSMAAVAQPAPQTPARAPGAMSMMAGQGPMRGSSMMNDPQMRQRMAEMTQGCQRMMSAMGSMTPAR